MAPLRTERYNGELVEITVTGAGYFVATFNDQRYEAPTLKELEEKLDKAAKKIAQQGSVEVTVLGIVPRTEKRSWGNDGPYQPGIDYVQAKLRSRHERQSNTFLLVSDDKKKFQISGWREGTICQRMEGIDLANYMRLAEANDAAKKALDEFMEAHSIDPDAALKKAVKK